MGERASNDTAASRRPPRRTAGRVDGDVEGCCDIGDRGEAHGVHASAGVGERFTVPRCSHRWSARAPWVMPHGGNLGRQCGENVKKSGNN